MDAWAASSTSAMVSAAVEHLECAGRVWKVLERASARCLRAVRWMLKSLVFRCITLYCFFSGEIQKRVLMSCGGFVEVVFGCRSRSGTIWDVLRVGCSVPFQLSLIGFSLHTWSKTGTVSFMLFQVCVVQSLDDWYSAKWLLLNGLYTFESVSKLLEIRRVDSFWFSAR